MKTLVSVFLALLCGPAFAAETTVWHFFDLWNFHRTDNVELCQGQPVWLRDKTYVDPFRENVADHLNSWPTVWRDNATGKWRMIYSAKWRPATLMAVSSRYKFIVAPDADPVLYDLDNDSFEMKNIFSAPGSRPIVGDLARSLLEYARRYKEPYADQPAVLADLAWAVGEREQYVPPKRNSKKTEEDNDEK